MVRLATAAALIALLLAPAANAQTTRGWAGYVVHTSGSAFDSVSASWVQPNVVCNRLGSAVAIWIGLGGSSAGSRALEQVGTSGDCSERGLVSYSAWYELFPARPVELPVTVRPGDTLNVAVTVTGSLVSVRFENVSIGAVFSADDWMAVPETDSAEWIVEAPSVCFTFCAPLPLADFGKVTFTNASTSTSGYTGAIDDRAWSRSRLVMAPRSRRVIATPTRLSSPDSFSVLRLRASNAR